MTRRKFAIRAKVPTGEISYEPSSQHAPTAVALPAGPYGPAGYYSVAPKTFNHRIGVATEMDDGTILLSFASIPINWNGKARLDDEASLKRHGKDNKVDDDIPF